MTIDETSLGSFGDLATAIGLLGPDGQPNAAWFSDPVSGGNATSGNGLKHLLADPGQRDALARFVDEVLGPPEARTVGGARWVPLFDEDDPDVTVSVVVTDAGDEVRLGVGFEHTTQGGPPSVTTRVHVPLFRFAERGSTLAGEGATPPWLLLGRAGGEIEVGVDATLLTAAPAAGTASLGGVGATVRIPTHGPSVGFAITLRDLQLPGAPAPRTFSLDVDETDDFGTEVLDLVAGLVRAQAEALDLSDPVFRPFAGLAGLLGLRDVPDLPAFPLADLPVRGVAALVGWVEEVLGADDARDAWLGQLATLVGGALDAAHDAVTLDVGPLRLSLGLRVEHGAGGHPVLVPWVELALDTQAGATALAVVDLLRADTATGTCTALPNVRLEGVFGADAGGTALVTGADPHVGSLHVGVGLDAVHQPVFVLTMHDVTAAGSHHPVLDLSTPDAALSAGSAVLSGALANALGALDPVGPLVAEILGISPPAGVSGLDAAQLVSDPVAAVRGYWADLVASGPAMATVLRSVQELVTGATVGIPGAGTDADPWVIELMGPMSLQVRRDGTRMRADLAAAVAVPVLGEYVGTSTLRFAVASADPVAGTVAFADGATLSLALARADGRTARLGLADLALVADRLAVDLVWTPSLGLRCQLAADGLAVELDAPDTFSWSRTLVPVPLPTIGADGRLTFPAPDWAAVEVALAALVSRVGVPELHAALDLLGWTGSGAHLSLAGLLGDDPVAAVSAWTADLALDCGRVREALGPVAALLSGFAMRQPLGTGNRRDPFRCPVAGEPAAPGLRVWLDPGCAVTSGQLRLDLDPLLAAEPPETDTIAAVLRSSGDRLPDLADLMVGRESLGDGLGSLADRWAGTDGLSGEPSTLPADVTGVVVEGHSYEELVARGQVDQLLSDVLDTAPASTVHVGCEASWLGDRAPGVVFDLTGTTPAATAVPATGTGTWFVRLPTPADARIARPDRGDVGEQAARLGGLLADRTDPVLLVGYGAAGAAVVRAAAAAPAVERVVTVGTPWSPLAVDSLRSGLGGDALRLLMLLQRSGVEAWPAELVAHECTPLQRTRMMVYRCQEALQPPSALPDAGAEVRRPGLGVHAVFGALDRDDVVRGLAAYVADGISSRVEAADSPGSQPVTALHAAIDLPVFDLDLGGLLVGVGAAVELCQLSRSGPGISVDLVRSVVVDLHLGVHDGWLVGGPGSAGEAGDLRWMSARVEVPLDGSPGDSELVLHEARGLGIDRERWVVRADALAADATLAVPEVRVLLSSVVARLRAASPDLGNLLDVLGLVRDAGLDPDGLDRLLHDPTATLHQRWVAASATAAGSLRALVSAATGSGAALAWTVGPAQVSLDLATGSVAAHLMSEVEGLATVDVEVTGTPAGAGLRLALGSVDPLLGGCRLVAEAGLVGSPATVAVEWCSGSTTRTVALWPDPDPGGLADLATILLPALGLKTLAGAALRSVSETGRPLLEQAYSVIGLLRVGADGVRRLELPFALVTDPADWFSGLARSASTDLGEAGVALLEALAPLVVPDRGAATGWPLSDEVSVAYRNQGGGLRVAVSGDLSVAAGSATVSTSVVAGVLLGAGAAPQPVVEVRLDVDGRGIVLTLDPSLRVSLVRPDPATPLEIYPAGPGIGQTLGAVAGSLVPTVLDLLADLSTGAAGFKRDVGTLVAELGEALQLRQAGHFDPARITEFAADPGGALVSRLPALLGDASAALVRALDRDGDLVRSRSAPGTVSFDFGTADSLSVTLDTTGPTPAVVVAANWTLPDVGKVVLDQLRLSAAGVWVDARIGPFPVEAGPVVLRPVLEVAAGSAPGSPRSVGLGLALDDDALRSVQVRWTLDARPPVLVAVTAGTVEAPDVLSEADGPAWLLSLAVSLAGGIAIDGLGSLFDARVLRMLSGVLLTEGATVPEIDPSFALDLLQPDRLLHRLERLLWNAATDAEPLTLTIDNTVTIALAHSAVDTSELLGISVSLAGGRRYLLADAGTRVELEVDATWLDPAVAPGLSVYAVRGTESAGAEPTYAFSFEPAVTVAGLGLRFTNAAGPLLELGPISIDGVAVRVYAEAGAAGVGGGVQLELAGLAFSPSGAGGTNAVANSILSDAGKSSPASRPAFSPAVAVQRHPGDADFKVTVRAGQPPGPWWLMVQRQLGPLYLERVGFNSAEVDGRVSQVSLLFDGRVEIFGLTAAVDQLSLTWLGGDLLDISRWAVDLQGLAVSADLSGISLAGGMLKTTDDGVVSYVGMLLGRFGIYGLSVFGGYTDDAGNPSFFVFGAVNGPIGGPPAFFVTGIGGGLGINRRLFIPSDPAQFPTYPFIQALDPYASLPEPMQQLRDLNVYFGPERGTFWFAGGISFTCFSLVDGIAVIAVSFGNGLEINLMGLARMALPNPAAPLVSIELGLLARFSTAEGVFMIRAALTDNSWLLYSDVRLTGGFAFVVWWKGPLAGQFVLTIGGYHPDFRREGYPDVPRVGLCWQVSNQIVIKGGAYFALTSEALMAGVSVEAVADFGWAWARARFGADGLVYFDPFFFDVHVYATISAGVEIDTWLGTFSFSITTGAEVHVWGPEFSGKARVRVGPCSVTIPFGSDRKKPGIEQDWGGFVAKYLEDAGNATARAISAITGHGSLPSATGGGRSAPTPDGTAARPFEVYAEFELTVTTAVPTSKFALGLGSDVTVPVVRSDGASGSLGINPMRAGELASTLRLRLHQLNQATGRWDDDPADLAQLSANAGAASPEPTGSRVATGSFPIGVWGPPTADGIEAPPLPTGDVLTTGNQVTLVAEAFSTVPGPMIDYYRVESERRPLPLQAAMDPRVALLDEAGTVVVPTPTTVRQALTTAGVRLFADAPALVTKGPQHNGSRSNLARASYVGEVSAPPLFGTLTDGLAIGNAANHDRSDQPPPDAAEGPEPRTPRLVGYLTSGAAVKARVGGTTVSDDRVKRRPAPTTDSVHARLGRHLPVQLDVTLPPGDKVSRTFTPVAVPRTGLPGAARSYGLGEAAAANVVVGLSGLGGTMPKGTKARRTAGVTSARGDGAPTLRPGDVVVLNAPDHAVDTGGRRPSLTVDGTARVTVLRGDGTVLLDQQLTGRAPVPAGAALIAVQADGQVAPVDGYAGWHARSRIVSLGSGSALASGCVLGLDNGAAGGAVSWMTASDAVVSADTVLTRFTSAVETVAVVVEADEPERVDEMALELIGASRMLDDAGEPVEPALLVNGTQAVAVYPVVPDPGAAAVAVKVTAGATWRLTGVLGANVPVDTVMSALVSDGVVGATGRLLAGHGDGCTVTWRSATRGGGRDGRG